MSERSTSELRSAPYFVWRPNPKTTNNTVAERFDIAVYLYNDDTKLKQRYLPGN